MEKQIVKRIIEILENSEYTGSFEENEWMTPEEMGIAQKMDWSDDDGDEISDEEKLEYFKFRNDMYEVDDENGLVRLRPEEEWFEGGDEEDFK